MTVKLSEVSTGAYVRFEDQRGEVTAQGPVSLWGSASEVCVRVHPMTLGDWLAWEWAPREYIEVRVPADAEVFCESGNVRGKVYVCEVSA